MPAYGYADPYYGNKLGALIGRFALVQLAPHPAQASFSLQGFQNGNRFWNPDLILFLLKKRNNDRAKD